MRPEQMCETVRIKTVVTTDNPEGLVVINKSDFVEGEHTLFDAPVFDANVEPPLAKPWAPQV